MQTCTVPEVAAELDRTEHHVYVLVREGHLRSIKEKRRYPNKLTGGYSVVEARVITRSSLDKYKRRYTPDVIPPGRISHAKAEAQYPDFGKSLNSWHAPIRRHTKNKNKITRRKCPLGRPLTVERYCVADNKGVLRLRIHYLVSELETIQELLRKGIGCIIEDGVLYKTAARLATDYRCTVAMVYRVFKRCPKSKRPKPIYREIPVRQAHGGFYPRQQRLWPDSWFQEVFKVRARRSPTTLLRNGKPYVTRKKASQISGCTEAILFWWYQQEHCVWLNRPLDVCEEPSTTRKGLRGPRATVYITQADAEALKAKRREAMKLGWCGRGKMPAAILKAIISAPTIKASTPSHLESIKGQEKVMDASWVKAIEQLNGQLVAIRNAVTDGADLLRAQARVKALCDQVTHESTKIGSEPGKLLSQHWDETGMVVEGAFSELPRQAGLTERQWKRLHNAFASFVEFLTDGTNDYDRRDLAGRVAKAINSYLQESGQGNVEPATINTPQGTPQTLSPPNIPAVEIGSDPKIDVIGPKYGMQKRYVDLAIREGITDTDTLTERCGGTAANARQAMSRHADFIAIEREKLARPRRES